MVPPDFPYVTGFNTDIVGNSRIDNYVPLTVDIGAYEYQGE